MGSAEETQSYQDLDQWEMLCQRYRSREQLHKRIVVLRF